MSIYEKVGMLVVIIISTCALSLLITVTYIAVKEILK